MDREAALACYGKVNANAFAGYNPGRLFVANISPPSVKKPFLVLRTHPVGWNKLWQGNKLVDAASYATVEIPADADYVLEGSGPELPPDRPDVEPQPTPDIEPDLDDDE